MLNLGFFLRFFCKLAPSIVMSQVVITQIWFEICIWLPPFHKQTKSPFYPANQGGRQERSFSVTSVLLLMILLSLSSLNIIVHKLLSTF